MVGTCRCLSRRSDREGRIQQLGASRFTHRKRQADTGQRSASFPGGTVALVPGTSQDRDRGWCVQLCRRDHTPGSPLILLGRSDTLAWGFTNTGSDVQDIFVERVNPDNPEQYLTPDGWTDFDSREEVIKISGGTETTFTLRKTRHGPVLPDSYLNIGLYLPENTVASIQWVALLEDDLTLRCWH